MRVLNPCTSHGGFLNAGTCKTRTPRRTHCVHRDALARSGFRFLPILFLALDPLVAAMNV